MSSISLSKYSPDPNRARRNQQFDDEFIITDFLFVEKMQEYLIFTKYYESDGLFVNENVKY